MPFAGYIDTTRKIVALRDVCQRVAGWEENKDPVREDRGPHGGGGWRTKGTLSENANRTMNEANRDLVLQMTQIMRTARSVAFERRKARC